jgi:autotransporter-associated beta strand protein
VAGSLVVQGGRLALTGTNTYTGGTTINGGTLQLGDGSSGHDGSITGAGGVTDNSLLVYNLNGSQTASYAITGNTNGAVTKTGPGTLTLANGGNTYAGGTNVLQGLLVVAPSSGALPYGPLNVSGGSLDVEGNTAVIANLSGNGTIGNGAVGVSNSASLLVIPDGVHPSNTTYSGTIRDGGFGGNAPIALQELGGSLTLSGTNTYSGGTTVTNGGTLIVTSPSGLADGSDLNIGDNVGIFPAPIIPAPVTAASGQGVSAVPEPAALALLGAAALVVAAASRRRKSRRCS